MRIKDWNVESANARQHKVEYGYCDTSASAEWIAGANIPFYLSGGLKPKKVIVTITVHGKDKREVKRNISDILSHCVGINEYHLDKDDHIFYGVMSGHSEEQKTDRWSNVKINLSCVEYGAEEIKKYSGSLFSFMNDGNVKTPVRISVKPKSTGQMSISFAGQTVSISSAVSGSEYVLDGIKGIFTKNGANAFSEFNISEMPYINPGNVTVSVTRLSDIAVTYNPFYM